MKEIDETASASLAQVAARLVGPDSAELDALVARCHAAEALLRLGYWEEWVPELAAEQLEDLTEDGASALVETARSTWCEELRFSEGQLALVSDAPLDRLDVPVLCADPEEAMATQAAARAVLVARERLHRLQRAVALLAGPDVGRELGDDLVQLDRGLRELLPSFGVLDAWREARARELPPGLEDEHWWFRQPTPPLAADEAPGSAPETIHEAAESPSVQSFAQWLEARGGRAAGGRLVLDAEEARELLATERGRRLAAMLDAKVDCSAAAQASSAAWTREGVERTVGDVLRELYGNVPAWARDGEPTAEQGTILTGLLERLAGLLAPPAPADLVLAAATAPRADRVVLRRGARALAEFECEAAWLEPEVGVVAIGRRRRHGDSGPRGLVWFLVPAPGVAAVVQRLAVGAPPVREAVDSEAVLLSWPALEPDAEATAELDLEGTDERRVLRLATQGRDSGGSLRHTEAFMLLIRALSHELFEQAEAVWDALKPELSIDEKRWGRGIEGLIEELLNSEEEGL